MSSKSTDRSATDDTESMGIDRRTHRVQEAPVSMPLLRGSVGVCNNYTHLDIYIYIFFLQEIFFLIYLYLPTYLYKFMFLFVATGNAVF